MPQLEAALVQRKRIPLVLLILSCLDPKSRKSAAGVCKLFRVVVQTIDDVESSDSSSDSDSYSSGSEDEEELQARSEQYKRSLEAKQKKTRKRRGTLSRAQEDQALSFALQWCVCPSIGWCSPLQLFLLSFLSSFLPSSLLSVVLPVLSPLVSCSSSFSCVSLFFFLSPLHSIGAKEKMTIAIAMTVSPSPLRRTTLIPPVAATTVM